MASPQRFVPVFSFISQIINANKINMSNINIPSSWIFFDSMNITSRLLFS